MIGDHHIGEVAYARILRSRERQLARLDLELATARRLSEEARRKQRIVDIDDRRRRPCARSKRDRPADQDPQLPHSTSPSFDCSAEETGQALRGS